MSSAIYFRMFGQAVALSVHGVNSLVMFVSMQDKQLMSNPDINQMVSLQTRYLTVWNIVFQMLYFSIALASDMATVTNRNHLLPKSTRNFREVLFAAIVFPITLLIIQIFWPFFLYDRSLIFPSFIDQIFSFKSNMVMHLAILPFALWELVFWPRTNPKSHKFNWTLYTIIYVTYISIVLKTYAEKNLFPYPILTMLYGTIYFPMLLIGAYFLSLLNYVIQWKLTAFIWGPKKRSDAKLDKKVK